MKNKKIVNLITTMLVITIMSGVVFAENLNDKAHKHLLRFSDYLIDNENSIYMSAFTSNYSGNFEIINQLETLENVMVGYYNDDSYSIVKQMNNSFKVNDGSSIRVVNAFISEYDSSGKETLRLAKEMLDGTMISYVEALKYGKESIDKGDFSAGLVSYLTSKGKELLIDTTKMKILSEKVGNKYYTATELNKIIEENNKAFSVLDGTSNISSTLGIVAKNLKTADKEVVGIVLDKFEELLLENISFTIKDIRILGNLNLPFIKNDFSLKVNESKPLYLLGKNDNSIQGNPLLIFYSENKNVAKIEYREEDGIYEPYIKAVGKKGSTTKIHVFTFGNFDEYVIDIFVK